MIVTREQLELRLLSLRQQQADLVQQIDNAKMCYARLEGRVEEASFWLFELAKFEQAHASISTDANGRSLQSTLSPPSG